MARDTYDILCTRDDIARTEEAECPHFKIAIEGCNSSQPSNDPVNHPSHYTFGNIECIDAIKAACGDKYEGFLQGTIIKYVWRYPHKNNPVEDLKKAEWYLERLIEEYKDGD